MSRSTTVASSNPAALQEEVRPPQPAERKRSLEVQELQQPSPLRKRARKQGGTSSTTVGRLVGECVRRGIEAVPEVVRLVREHYLEVGKTIRPALFADVCRTVALGVEYRLNKSHNSSQWEGGSEHVCGPLTDRFDSRVADELLG